MTRETLLEQLTGVRLDDAADIALLGAGFAAVLIAAQIGFKLHRTIRRAASRRPVRADMVATVIGAVIVLALSVEGMWEFFGAIGMDGPARAVFCAVFEICLIAVALRSRHIRLLRQARKDALAGDEKANSIRLRGINDALVWALAAVIGVLAAAEAPSGAEQVFRFIVPFIATVMWELALGADVEDQRVTTTAKHWIDRVRDGFATVGRSCVSIAVKLGWVPPTSADATEQYREKRMTRLVDISHQIHTTEEEKKAKLLCKQRRLILDLQARGQWTRETLTELSERLDVIFRAVELTAPAAVRPSAPAKQSRTPRAEQAPKPVERKPAPSPAVTVSGDDVEMTGSTDPADLLPSASRDDGWELLSIEDRAERVWAECAVQPSAQQFAIAIGCAKSTANEHRKKILEAAAE